MAAPIIPPEDRARQHPMFLNFVALEVSRLEPSVGLDEAFRLAKVEAVKALAGADPADVLLSNEEFDALI